MESKVQLQKTHFLVYYSAQSLEQYMRAGVTHLINSILNNSDRLVQFRYWLPQLMLSFDFMTKLYFLSKHKATYAEYFYGLQRESGSTVLKSAAILSLYPYVRARMEQLYERLKMKFGREDFKTWEKIYFHAFPVVHFLIQGFELIIRASYLLSDKSVHFDLLFWLLKARLVYKQNQQAGNALLDLLNKPFILAIFLLYKVFNWYYSGRSNKVSVEGDRQVSAPFVGEANKSHKGMCPVCGRKIVNPAMLSSSGYVFCYGCVANEVKTNRRCPITGVPSSENNIHTLYQ